MFEINPHGVNIHFLEMKGFNCAGFVYPYDPYHLSIQEYYYCTQLNIHEIHIPFFTVTFI